MMPLGEIVMPTFDETMQKLFKDIQDILKSGGGPEKVESFLKKPRYIDCSQIHKCNPATLNEIKYFIFFDDAHTKLTYFSMPEYHQTQFPSFKPFYRDITILYAVATDNARMFYDVTKADENENKNLKNTNPFDRKLTLSSSGNVSPADLLDDILTPRLNSLNKKLIQIINDFYEEQNKILEEAHKNRLKRIEQANRIIAEQEAAEDTCCSSHRCTLL